MNLGKQRGFCRKPDLLLLGDYCFHGGFFSAVERESEKGQRDRRGLRQKKMRFKSEVGGKRGRKQKEEKNNRRRAAKTADEEGIMGKESSCTTVFSRANWDELPTGNLTLVMRH